MIHSDIERLRPRAAPSGSQLRKRAAGRDADDAVVVAVGPRAGRGHRGARGLPPGAGRAGRRARRDAPGLSRRHHGFERILPGAGPHVPRHRHAAAARSPTPGWRRSQPRLPEPPWEREERYRRAGARPRPRPARWPRRPGRPLRRARPAARPAGPAAGLRPWRSGFRTIGAVGPARRLPERRAPAPAGRGARRRDGIRLEALERAARPAAARTGRGRPRSSWPASRPGREDDEQLRQGAEHGRWAGR